MRCMADNRKLKKPNLFTSWAVWQVMKTWGKNYLLEEITNGDDDEYKEDNMIGNMVFLGALILGFSMENMTEIVNKVSTKGLIIMLPTWRSLDMASAVMKSLLMKRVMKQITWGCVCPSSSSPKMYIRKIWTS